MRIFQLNTYCGIKSTGRIALEIAKLVKADGGECLIGYGVPEISEDSRLFAFKVGNALERKIHGAIRKFFDAEGYGSYLGTRKLIRQLNDFQPDLVHFHNLHGCYLHLPSLFRYLKKSNVPVVWTLHDCWPFTGHCAYFDYSGCDRWKKGCHDCIQQRSYPTCIGLDGSRRNFALKKKWFRQLKNLTFVAPCQWMLQPLKQSFMRDYPAKVILNGVNLNAFRPTESDVRLRFHLEDKHLCLAVAAEWDARKGLPYLCQAAEQLGESYAFVVIGLDPSQMENLPSNVIGLERTASIEELASWYSAADCFVNPTLEDNMPMVNLESLACGTPVAVFRTGGCPEALDESTGMVVEQGDVNALCESIQLLCAQKVERTMACVERAKLFDCNQTFAQYLALYKELCK